jgi:hypothetical protein
VDEAPSQVAEAAESDIEAPLPDEPMADRADDEEEIEPAPDDEAWAPAEADREEDRS